MGQTRPLFAYIRPFQMDHKIWLYKSVYGAFGIWTHPDRKIVGADESTEL